MRGFFKGKVYGTATVGERGQVVIPAELRRSLKIKSGDKLIVVSRPGGKMVGLIPADAFNKFLSDASKHIAKLEKRVSSKSR